MNILILTFEDGGKHHIVIPPGNNRTDIITGTNGFKFMMNGYTYGFDGLIIMTGDGKRSIWMDGKKMYERSYPDRLLKK